MKRLILTCILAVIGTPSMAQNTQPISVSLAECSVIFKVMRISAAQKGKSQEQLDKLKKGSEVFLNEAYKQAESEGQASGYIAEQLPRLGEKWDSRWLSASTATLMANMNENMDWVQYCGKLGKHKGILPVK